MIRFVILGLLLAGEWSYAQENRLNSLVDEIIYEQTQNLIKNGKDKIRLPDFHKKYEKQIVGSFELEAEVHLENGWFENTTSLYRIGDVEERDNEDESMSFSATFGMKEVKVRNEDFSWRFWIFEGSGDMEAECVDNAMSVGITVRYDRDSHCSVTLDRAELIKLGGFRVVYKPERPVNNIKSQLFTCALNSFSDKIMAVVNANLKDSLSAALSKLDVCGLLPF